MFIPSGRMSMAGHDMRRSITQGKKRLFTVYRRKTLVMRGDWIANAPLYVSNFLENPRSGRLAWLRFHFMVVLIILSLIASVAETNVAMRAGTERKALLAFEMAVTILLTIEYLLRLSVCHVLGYTRWRYMRRFFSICDLISILPYYVYIISPEARGLEIVLVLRLFRVTRLVESFSFSNKLRLEVIALTCSSCVEAFEIILTFAALALLICSATLYSLEKLSCPFNFDDSDQLQRYNTDCDISSKTFSGWSTDLGRCCIYACDPYVARTYEVADTCPYYITPGGLNSQSVILASKWASIEAGPIQPTTEMNFLLIGPTLSYSITANIWFVFATMTTVGYGDVIPLTLQGRLMAVLTFLSGIVLLSLPVAVLGSKIQGAFIRIERNERMAKKEELRSNKKGGVSTGKLSRKSVARRIRSHLNLARARLEIEETLSEFNPKRQPSSSSSSKQHLNPEEEESKKKRTTRNSKHHLNEYALKCEERETRRLRLSFMEIIENKAVELREKRLGSSRMSTPLASPSAAATPLARMSTTASASPSAAATPLSRMSTLSASPSAAATPLARMSTTTSASPLAAATPLARMSTTTSASPSAAAAAPLAREENAIHIKTMSTAVPSTSAASASLRGKGKRALSFSLNDGSRQKDREKDREEEIETNRERKGVQQSFGDLSSPKVAKGEEAKGMQRSRNDSTCGRLYPSSPLNRGTDNTSSPSMADVTLHLLPDADERPRLNYDASPDEFIAQVGKLVEKSFRTNKELVELTLVDLDIQDQIMKHMICLVSEIVKDQSKHICLPVRTSLGIFSMSSNFRKSCYWISRSGAFEGFILILIVINAILLAMQRGWDGPDTWPSVLLRDTEIFFLICFTIELFVKIVGIGFFQGKGTYLRDAWNWIDFLVVISGIIAFILNQSNTTSGETLNFLRGCRILRPLRALSALKGLRKLITTIINTLPQLLNVTTMAALIFIVFGVLGITLFGGVMHRRCRLTPGPISFAQEVASCSNEWCFTPDGATTSLVTSKGFTKKHNAVIFAAWCTPECVSEIAKGNPYNVWPIDDTQRRLCGGAYQCGSTNGPLLLAPTATHTHWFEMLEGESLEHAENSEIHNDNDERETKNDTLVGALRLMGVSILHRGTPEVMVNLTTCGGAFSDDKLYGLSNPDLDHSFRLPEFTHLDDYLSNSNNLVELNFGWSNFDNAGASYLVIFQILTLEGWVDIMYMLQDGYGNFFPAIFFCLLIFLGAFFLLNIMLAIIMDGFSSIDAEGNPQKEALKKETAEKKATDLVQMKMSEIKLSLALRRSKFRRLVHAFAFDTRVSSFIMCAITVNVCILAIDSFPPPHQEVLDFLHISNVVFCIIFAWEMLIMIIALGPRRYFHDLLYAFDCFIVVVSILELSFSGGSVLIAMRGFRLLRIFKLANKLESFRTLLKSVIGTLKQMGDFVVLLLLVLSVLTMLGQSLFSGQFVFDENGMVLKLCQGYEKFEQNKEFCEKACPLENGVRSCIPRAHFDDFYWGFLTVFQILTWENWNNIMFDAMNAIGWWGCFYFIITATVANFIVTNLFLAIMMSNFEKQRIELVEKQRKNKMANKLLVASIAGRILSGKKQISKKNKISQSLGRSQIVMKMWIFRTKCEFVRRFTVLWNIIGSRVVDISGGADRSGGNEPWRDYSLFLFSPENRVRILCKKICTDPRFDTLILAHIIISSMIMAIGRPLMDPRDGFSKFLGNLNIYLMLIFTAEMCIKVITYGFILVSNQYIKKHHRGKDTIFEHDKPYLRLSWNWLDAFVVIVSIYEVLASGASVASLRTLRLLRTLRPLRLIARNQNLRVVIETLIKSVPELANLILFLVLFWFISSLLGISFFAGTLYRCVDQDLEELSYLDVEHGGLPRSHCVDPTPPHLLLPTCSPASSSTSSPSSSSSSSFIRPTSDYPLCVVQCDETHCSSAWEAPAWGYQLQRCSQCERRFCEASFRTFFSNEGGKTAPIIRRAAGADEKDHCTLQCATDNAVFADNLMCSRVNRELMLEDPIRQECIRECAAACRCDHWCKALKEDAALCVEAGGRWLNMDRNFDNIREAMIALFEITTTEGWMEVLHGAIDSTQAYRKSKRDSKLAAGIFFFFFMCIGSFFLIQLTVGVIIDNFNKIKSQSSMGKSVLLTPQQQKWVENKKLILVSKISFPVTDLHLLPLWRQRVFGIVASREFETMIVSCILMNTGVMMMEVVPSPRPSYAAFINIATNFFMVIYNAEFVVKLLAYGWRGYFQENWNRFDFTIIFVTDFAFLIDAVADTVLLGSLMTTLRLFRIARVFRMVRFLKGLNRIFNCFILSLPKLANVAAILFLLISLFAILGMNLFAATKLDPGVRVYANFDTFDVAALTLIRSMTGEGWNFLMHDLSRNKYFHESILNQKCVTVMDINENTYEEYESNGMISTPSECGSYYWPRIFFIAFTCLISFVVLNLFIAVIFEGFEEASKSDSLDVIRTCAEMWPKFDTNYTMFLDVYQALKFIDLCVSMTNGDPKENGKNKKIDEQEESSSIRSSLGPHETHESSSILMNLNNTPQIVKRLFHSACSRPRTLSKISEKYKRKIDDRKYARRVASPTSRQQKGGRSSRSTISVRAREVTSFPPSFSSEQKGGSSSSSLGAKASAGINVKGGVGGLEGKSKNEEVDENAEPDCNIKYSRLLQLVVTNDGKVHYSYCFLGVLRKLILLEHFASTPGKLRTKDLSEALKSLENIMIPPSSGGGDSLAGDKEMKRLEEKHLEKVNKTNKKRKMSQIGKEGHIGDVNEDLNLSFTEMLAATKIQRMFKKKVNNRRLEKNKSATGHTQTY